MALTYAGGAAYDANGNGKIDNNESAGRDDDWPAARPRRSSSTSTCTSARPGRTAPTCEAFGDPEDFNNGIGQVGVRILSWREVQ